MRNWLRRWLGIGALEARMTELASAQPVTMAIPEIVPDAVEETVPPEVEAMVNFMWKDAPQAASSTRTYARSMLASGVRPDTVARLVREHGTVIE